MARTKTNTRDDTITLTTSWRNRHLKTYIFQPISVIQTINEILAKITNLHFIKYFCQLKKFLITKTSFTWCPFAYSNHIRDSIKSRTCNQLWFLETNVEELLRNLYQYHLLGKYSGKKCSLKTGLHKGSSGCKWF